MSLGVIIGISMDIDIGMVMRNKAILGIRMGIEKEIEV